VERALAAEDPETGTGYLQALKQAMSELDRATQPLAELLMDHVLEKMLRQKGAIS